MNNRLRRILLPVVLSSGGSAELPAPEYLGGPFRFTEAHTAPQDAAYTESGVPGQLNFVVTVNDYVISTEKLNLIGAGDYTQNKVYGDALTSAVGLAFGMEFKRLVVGGGSIIFLFGFHPDTTFTSSLETGISINGTTLKSTSTGSDPTIYNYEIPQNNTIKMCVVLQHTRHLNLFYDGANWLIVWVSQDISGHMDTGSSVRPAFNANTAGQNDGDNVWWAQLAAPFTTAFGQATYHDATPTANDTAVIDADGTQYLDWTIGTGEKMLMYARRTDDNNCYRLECNASDHATPNKMFLYRVEGGVATEIGGTGGINTTFTVGQTRRIGFRVQGTRVTSWFSNPSGDIVIKHNVTGETFNQSATGAKVAGFAAGANWEAYPWLLGAAGVSEVNRFFP